MQSKILENSSRDTFDGFVFRMKRQERRKRRPPRQKHPKFIGQESESTSQKNLLQGITRLPNRYDVNYLNLLINFPRNWIWVFLEILREVPLIIFLLVTTDSVVFWDLQV